jgi:hypothetical protein
MTTEAMTWGEFREQAAKRAGLHAIEGELRHRLAYLALGLCGEAGEYERASLNIDGDDADQLSELGDVAWYLAMIEHATCYRAAWPALDGEPVEWHGPLSLSARAGAVAECAKRPMQGRSFPEDRMQKAIDDVAREIAYEAQTLGGMAALYAANIAKTTARFGAAGFTVEKARALDAAAKGARR